MKLNKKETLNIDDFISLPDMPVERDIYKRNLDHLKILEPNHTEVSTIEVIKEFTDPNTGNFYPAGYKCKNDGHGRAMIWKTNQSDKVPPQVTNTRYEADSWKGMVKIYDNTDSSKSVEKPKEKFLARLKNHGIEIDDNRLSAIQPLGFASHLIDPKKNPNTSGFSAEQIQEAVNLLHPQYKIMQDYICAGNISLHKKSKGKPFDFNNIIITASLIALNSFEVTPELMENVDTDNEKYIHGMKLIDLIRTINKGGKNTMAPKWDAITQIVNEFDGNGVLLKHWHKNNMPTLDLGSYVTCISFVLYWILQHMKGATHENLPNNKKVWSTVAKNFSEIVQEKFIIYNKMNIDNILKIAS